MRLLTWISQGLCLWISWFEPNSSETFWVLLTALAIFPNTRGKHTEASTQWYSSTSERGGQEEHSTAPPLQLRLQGKSRAAFCCVAFGTFVIQHPCQPAACLGGLLTNTAYLKHLFFFLSQTSFTSSRTGFTAHSAVPTGSSAAAPIFLGVFPYPGLGLPSSGNARVFPQLPPQL